MKIGPELPATYPAGSGAPATVRNPQGSVSQNGSSNTAPNSPSPENQEPATQKSTVTEPLSLSFRKDSNGRTYYVLTDPQSGQIVREIPPEEIRNVSQGIDDYLKSEAQAAQITPKTDSNA
jgi:uncharacterized FlaG/YvyC family protein